MEVRTRNDNYYRIAQEIIETDPALEYIKNSKVKIAYLDSDACKKAGQEMLVHGECEKVPAKYRWAIAEDFTITLFYNNNIGMSEEQIKILLFHELLHIGIDYADGGAEVYSIIKHDLEDFKTIIDKYGVDWADVAR